MIRASGARGSGFDPRSGPTGIFFILCIIARYYKRESVETRPVSRARECREKLLITTYQEVNDQI